MNLAGNGDQGIEAPDLLEQSADRIAVGDIDLMVAAAIADLDDLMTVLKGRHDEFSDCAGRTHNDDLHIKALLGRLFSRF